MATALTAQLAQIRAKTTNSLDLKAQKKAHSQSLLFDPPVAATQDFDTIYQVCCEGYQELCQLDSRFNSFARNIFSEQSKQEDRTQMTAEQNQELDVVLEKFLGLVGGRLLLKPAIKAVEWLVRRFRIHEYNLICFTLTFLPYHTTTMFPALLSILPRTAPPALKFLNPYISPPASPPRHTIVYSTTHNKPFLAALNAYVLKVSKLGHHHRTLLSFWATVITEAVATMLDHSRSARPKVQRQNEEDMMLSLLPTLNEGLSLRKVSDLTVGCYMILTVLSNKISLDDKVLTAMMEAVTSGWAHDTMHAGLICLSVLAQRRQTIVLPKRVLMAVMAIKRLDDDLLTLSKEYSVDRLALGLVLGITDGIGNIHSHDQLSLVRALIEGRLMNDAFIEIAINCILSVAHDMSLQLNQELDVQGHMADLILRLADSQQVGQLVHDAIRDTKVDLAHLEMKLQTVISTNRNASSAVIEDVEMKELDQLPTLESFEAVVARIPSRTAYEISFLSHSDSFIFASLSHALRLATSSSTNLRIFSNLPVLRRSLAMTEPLFLSFFIRVWCGNSTPRARVAAIDTVSEYFREEKLMSDVQILLPYLIHALADASAKVRCAATDLVLVLAPMYARSDVKDRKQSNRTILGEEHIYGQGKETKEVSWLSWDEMATLIEKLIVPSLEECSLDKDYISRRLSDALIGTEKTNGVKSTHKEFRTSLRAALLTTLSSHVINTPLYAVKLRLLPMLNLVEKAGNVSRTKALLPLLSQITSQSQKELEEICSREHIDILKLLNVVVGIVSPGDREGLHLLQSIIENRNLSVSMSLTTVVLQHIQQIWSSIKADLQSSLAKSLLDLAVADSDGEQSKVRESEALDTLRRLTLSGTILSTYLETLPVLSADSQDRPSASKRRRTSQSQAKASHTSDRQSIAEITQKITVVLELIEASKAERHPRLLKGLFDVIADLQRSKIQSDIELGYPLVLALGSSLAIVDKLTASSSQDLDRSAIRANTLIDCVRTTTNPQVQHAALLLVSSLASVTPELILHSVMPVFTFMASSIMCEDDEYSAYVVKRTMESVIPRLVESLHQQKGDPIAGASELLLSFVGAFEHIPSHRRLMLFHSLADKLGPNEYLFILLALLVDKYPSNKRVVQFATELTDLYPVTTQLHTLLKYLEMVLDHSRPKPTFSEKILIRGDSRPIEGTTINLLPLISQILVGERLSSVNTKALLQDGVDPILIRSLFQKIVERTFVLSEQYKHHKKLNIACSQILDAALSLLLMPDFISTIRILLQRSDEIIQCQILMSFDQRLNSDKTDSLAAEDACLAFLPQLTSIIEGSTNGPLQHTALSCVDRIIERFGKKNHPAVTIAAAVICSNHCLGATGEGLNVMALLCLATIVETLGEAFIPIIPQALPKAFDHLAASIEENHEDERLHNAVYSFIYAFLLYVPWMLTGAHLERLLKASHESANAEMGEICDQNRNDTLRLVAKHVDLKEELLALDRTWASAMTEGPKAIKEQLEVLRLTIEGQPKSSIMKQASALSGLLLKAFDLRRIQLCPRTEDSYEDLEVEEFEEATSEVALKMIFKLNDTTFKPLFMRILDWATTVSAKEDQSARIYRQITCFGFLHTFFDTLKSIVTSYASFILESAVQILSNVSVKDDDSKVLWKRVNLTLQKAFEHDQDDFWQTPSHFDSISSPLLSQLRYALHLPMTSEVIPAIVELAVAADSPNHHKEMNAAILKYMRSDNPAIRLAAVQCEAALTDRLGEEWLALLAEMLPFISELQEDDDEGVEQETQRWIEKIEGILGESLNPMLQ